MCQMREKHLQEQAMQQEKKGQADTCHVNSHSACILKRGTVLAELKRKQDEKEAKEAGKQQKREDEREV